MGVADERRSGDPDRLVQNPKVLTRSGSFGRVLMSSTAEQPTTLRGTGTDLWDFFERPHTEPQLVAWLAQQYQVDSVVIAIDVAAAIKELLREDLLQWTR